MARRISKRVREEAALICAIAASTEDMHDSYRSICRELDIAEYSEANDLALDAWCAARDAGWAMEGPCDAEAEALLRTGWTPGDSA